MLCVTYSWNHAYPFSIVTFSVVLCPLNILLRGVMLSKILLDHTICYFFVVIGKSYLMQHGTYSLFSKHKYWNRALISEEAEFTGFVITSLLLISCSGYYYLFLDWSYLYPRKIWWILCMCYSSRSSELYQSSELCHHHIKHMPQH